VNEVDAEEEDTCMSYEEENAHICAVNKVDTERDR
jgi:hypothetical protein